MALDQNVSWVYSWVSFRSRFAFKEAEMKHCVSKNRAGSYNFMLMSLQILYNAWLTLALSMSSRPRSVSFEPSCCSVVIHHCCISQLGLFFSLFPSLISSYDMCASLSIKQKLPVAIIIKPRQMSNYSSSMVSCEGNLKPSLTDYDETENSSHHEWNASTDLALHVPETGDFCRVEFLFLLGWSDRTSLYWWSYNSTPQ
jgi:hypothetical protein